MTLYIRELDKAIFRPSYTEPHEYAEYGTPFDGLLNGGSWFFRRVERVGLEFPFLGFWKETGEVWRPKRDQLVIYRGNRGEFI